MVGHRPHDADPLGRGDALGWKRLLGALDYADPRRSLAAAQVSSLPAAYGA
jgi:hypothetical protein